MPDHFKNYGVLNSGVASYSPSIYFCKVEYLMDSGLEFDEVVVYIDISDIQDEAAFYREDENGNIYSIKDAHLFFAGTEECRFYKLRKSLYYSYFSLCQLEKEYKALTGVRFDEPNPDRSHWTFTDKVKQYGDLGVEGGIKKAKRYMDRLEARLDKKQIPLSIGVYPWKSQLINNDQNSRQVRIWEEWCQTRGCKHFINHFPDFFKTMQADPD